MAYKMVTDPKIGFSMMGQATFIKINMNGKWKCLKQDLVVFMLVSKNDEE